MTASSTLLPMPWSSAGSSESGGGSSTTARESTVAPIVLSSCTSSQLTGPASMSHVLELEVAELSSSGERPTRRG